LNQDFVIIGGGIAALSTAWELHQQKLSFVILYQPRNGSATQAAAGMLCPEIEADSAKSPLLALAKKSQQQYPAWIAGLEDHTQKSCGYNNKGTLLVAQHQDHMAEIAQTCTHIEEQGYQCQRRTIKELRSLEENLAPRLAGGISIPDAHSIHPRMLYSALYRALEDRIYSCTRIHLTHNNRTVQSISYRTQEGVENKILAKNIIVADGAWSQSFPVLNWLPMRPVKGQFLIVHGNPLIEHTIRTPDVYMVPRPNGEIYIGATMEEEGFSMAIRAGHQLDLLYHSWQFIRGIYELNILESGVGFRPALRDHQPAIGRSQLSNLWLNIGHFRHGITIAPAASKYLLHQIEQSATDGLFSPLRFWDSS